MLASMNLRVVSLLLIMLLETVAASEVTVAGGSQEYVIRNDVDDSSTCCVCVASGMIFVAEPSGGGGGSSSSQRCVCIGRGEERQLEKISTPARLYARCDMSNAVSREGIIELERCDRPGSCEVEIMISPHLSSEVRAIIVEGDPSEEQQMEILNPKVRR